MLKQYKALEMSPDDRSFRWPRPTTVTTPALLLTQNVTHSRAHNVKYSRVHNVTQHDDSAYSCSSKFHRMTTPKWQHTCFTLPWLTMTSLRQASDKFHHLLKFWGQFTPSDCPVLVIISSSSVCHLPEQPTLPLDIFLVLGGCTCHERPEQQRWAFLDSKEEVWKQFPTGWPHSPRRGTTGQRQHKANASTRARVRPTVHILSQLRIEQLCWSCRYL